MRNVPGSRPRLVAALLALLSLLVVGAAVAAAARTGAIIFHPQPTATQIPREPPPTPAATSYVYFYSRVEYPLELRVNDTSDSVTLRLSFEKNILLVTPAPGSGVTPISNLPFSLPSDLRPYQDISAEADAMASGRDSPVIWQLVSPPRQSLLRPPAPGAVRDYVSSVTFSWRVSAVHAGPNLVTISLAISYTLLNGAEEQGQIEVSPDPIPILAVDPPPVTLLPNFRIEIVGLISLVGLINVLSFFWNVFSVVDTVIAKLQAIRDLFRRRSGRRRVPPAAPLPTKSLPPAPRSTHGATTGKRSTK